MIRMTLGIHELVNLDMHCPVRRVVIKLPEFVSHDISLIIEFGLVDHQTGHPVGLKKQGSLKIV